MIFQNVFDDGEGQEIIILKLFDRADAVDIALVVVGDVAAPLAGFGQKAFADIVVHGFFGNLGALNQFSDFQGSPSVPLGVMASADGQRRAYAPI